MFENHIVFCQSEADRTGKGYWQCGMWMKTKREATVYPSLHEAEAVMLYRTLPSDTIAVKV